MPNYAPRVSLSYNDLSGVVALWSQSCARMAVYEHEADEEVPTTHVHLIMIDSKYKTAEAMKREFYRFIQTDRKGNELWSWHHRTNSNPDITFLTYMSKGQLRPKFTKNITPAEVEEHRALWVDHKKTPVASSTDEQIKKLTKYEIVKAVQAYFEEKAPKDIFGKPLEYEVPDDSILQCIRRILIDNHQALGIYKVMDIYDAYIMYANKTKFIHNCLNILEKRQPRV